MKALLIVLPLLMTNIAHTKVNEDGEMLEMKSQFFQSLEFASLENKEIAFNYIKKDLCYTGHVPDDCVLSGPEIRFDFPLYKKAVYGFARLADLKTRRLKSTSGDPYYVTLEAEIGLGSRVKINEIISAVAEISFNSASDTEYYTGESQVNYNAGPAFRTKLEAQITEKIALCIGYVVDNSQNASAEKYHAFKDKKPRMFFGKAELCGKIKISDRIYLIASIQKMVRRPSEDKSTVRDGARAQEFPEFPDLSIGFKYIFK